MPLVYKSIQFKYNFSPGSVSSVLFLSSLKNDTTNLDAFSSPAIQAILIYKWSMIKMRAYIRALLYAIYIIILFVHIHYNSTDTITTYILIGYGAYFTLSEIYTIILSGIKFFKDIWNFCDLAIAGLLLSYSVSRVLGKGTQEDYNIIIAVINLLSWIRLISLLRLFK